MQVILPYRAAAILLLSVAPLYTAIAADETSPSLKLKYVSDALKAKPDNRFLSLHLADLAIETGDYEVAIAPIEKMMLLHPEDAQLKLKLGILYYMIGSYDASKTYLEQLLTPRAEEPEVTAQAKIYLARM